MVTTVVKHRFIPHAIIKINGITRHTAQGEKYWTLERGTYVFQIGFVEEKRAVEVAERINSGAVKLNPDLWKDKMPKELQ